MALDKSGSLDNAPFPAVKCMQPIDGGGLVKELYKREGYNALGISKAGMPRIKSFFFFFLFCSFANCGWFERQEAD